MESEADKITLIDNNLGTLTHSTSQIYQLHQYRMREERQASRIDTGESLDMTWNSSLSWVLLDWCQYQIYSGFQRNNYKSLIIIICIQIKMIYTRYISHLNYYCCNFLVCQKKHAAYNSYSYFQCHTYQMINPICLGTEAVYIKGSHTMYFVYPT